MLLMTDMESRPLPEEILLAAGILLADSSLISAAAVFQIFFQKFFQILWEAAPGVDKNALIKKEVPMSVII